METTVTKKPWEFDVEIVPLKGISDLSEVKDLERDVLLINKDLNARIGMVSRQFTPIPHKQAVDQTVEAINEVSKEDSRFASYKIREDKLVIRKNGGFLKLDFDFPDINFDVGKNNKLVNDIVSFRLSLLNGFDGYQPLQVRAGGNRLICKNGLTAFHSFDSLSVVHKHLKIPTFQEAIRNQLKVFTTITDEWKNLAGKQISDQEISALFKEARKQAEEKHVAEAHIDRIEKIAPEIFEQEGHSLWTFYNLATNYTTHNVKLNETKNLVNRVLHINSLFYETALQAA